MKYQKYTWVCTGDCDALIEYTIKDGFGWPAGEMNLTCRCGSSATCLSVEDATISPTTTEEESMETVEYLKAQLDIAKSAIQSHQNCDYWKSENGRIGSQLISLVNEAYDNEADASEILLAICQIIDYTPVKTIEYTATISFTGSIDIPRDEEDTFDLSEVLGEAYVDINNGNVTIDSHELYDAEEC